jgi:hypothetical protein
MIVSSRDPFAGDAIAYPGMSLAVIVCEAIQSAASAKLDCFRLRAEALRRTCAV